MFLIYEILIIERLYHISQLSCLLVADVAHKSTSQLARLFSTYVPLTDVFQPYCCAVRTYE
jgi:AraC-like DNA-binding protein